MASNSISGNLSNGTGLDVQATVDQLMQAERAPERLWQSQQSVLNSQAAALKSIQSKVLSLQDVLNTLKDFSGVLNSRVATSSQLAVVSASADSSAVDGIHTVIVNNLATFSSFYSTAIADPSFTFGSGAGLELQAGSGASAVIDLDGKTLEQAAVAINASSAGVRATVIRDASGSILSLVSQTMGENGRINILSDSSSLNWQIADPGENAHFSVDGVPLETSTNQVANVLPGITLTLNATNSGNPVSITVGPDQEKVKHAISSFVTNYNALVKDINRQFAFDSASGHSGVLSADSTLRLLQSTLLSNISYSAAGNSIGSLRSLGIKMENDGTLSIDDSLLDSALANNYSSLQSFFQGTSSSGFARNFADSLSSMTDSVNGALSVDLKGIEDSSQDISHQIERFETMLSAREQLLIEQYTRIDLLLRQMPVTQAQISAQLGTLNTNK